jgi:hypothetical protein
VKSATEPENWSRAACAVRRAQAQASWHKKEWARKYDPSRAPRPGARARRASGPDDRGGLPPIADDGGWRRDAESGGRACDRPRRNRPGPARKSGRCRRPGRNRAPGKCIAGTERVGDRARQVSLRMDSRDRRWDNAHQVELVLRKRGIQGMTPVVCAAGVIFFCATTRMLANGPRKENGFGNDDEETWKGFVVKAPPSAMRDRLRR